MYEDSVGQPQMDYYTKFQDCEVLDKRVVYEDYNITVSLYWLKGYHYFPGGRFIPHGLSGGGETELKVVEHKEHT